MVSDIFRNAWNMLIPQRRPTSGDYIVGDFPSFRVSSLATTIVHLDFQQVQVGITFRCFLFQKGIQITLVEIFIPAKSFHHFASSFFLPDKTQLGIFFITGDREHRSSTSHLKHLEDKEGPISGLAGARCRECNPETEKPRSDHVCRMPSKRTPDFPTKNDVLWYF